MKKLLLLLPLAMPVACLSLNVHAQALTEKQISLDIARDIAIGAIEDCRKAGYQVAVTVVDRAGQEKAALRDDGAGPHTMDTSRRKAFTALTFKRPTIEMGKHIAANPAIANLKDISGVLILGGGVPVRADNQIIGAVGVSGAPGGDKDEACSLAGIAKVAGKLR